MIVDGNEIGCYDGIVKIIYQDKCRAIVLTANGEDDEFVTLNDFLKIIEWKPKMGVVLVIIESWTSGKIYQWANNCGEPVWCEHGTTKGFA